ncbi:putative two component transcriptional regulator, sigma54-specific [Desulfosarcina variabilis str. Montpellier]
MRNETQQRHKRLPGLAGGGTIFLDEIHTMDKATQMKILRVIEDRQVTRIGGKSPIPLDIRIIAASSEKMDAEMAAGNFLAPLYYRLNVVKLAIPSLRQRKADIPILVAYFIEKMNARFDRSIKKVSPEAMNVMAAYGWPGNVRELKNCLERAFNEHPAGHILSEIEKIRHFLEERAWP